MPLLATTSVGNWDRSRRVETSTRTGAYVTADTILLVAGPGQVSDTGGLNLNLTKATENAGLQFGSNAYYPIGHVESIGITQQQMIQRMYEIGSRQPYQMAGRGTVDGQLGRVMFKGNSLLRVLYAAYPNAIAMANGRTLDGNDSISTTMVQTGALRSIFPEIIMPAGAFTDPNPEGNGQPDSFMISLNSDLFGQPFGLGMIIRDAAGANLGAFYIENCLVSGHALQVQAASALLTENVSFSGTAVVPMEFSSTSGALTPAPGNTL